MDLGHPVRLGVRLELDADPAHLVERARLAERLGLDLVAVREPTSSRAPDGQAPGVTRAVAPRLGAGPGEPASSTEEQRAPLDTWTVLSWVASSTESVTLLALGLDLGSRPAPVLGRAAASLDRLSDGRLEIGLGTPDEEGLLAEAVEAVRGILEAGGPEPLDLDGEHLLLRGAQRGPAPAHEIPLWLDLPAAPEESRDPARADDISAPGRVELVGTHADGVVLRQDTRRVASLDRAARAAGRAPDEVQRLLELTAQAPGSPEELAEELTRLVLEESVSTFLLPDSVELQLFAEQVVPRVRARVAAARERSGVVVGVPVPARVRVRRRPGIDYDAVPAGVPAVEPGAARFAELRNTYLRGGDPGLVLVPRSSEELAAALSFVREQEVPLGVRSGGHGVSGRSTNDGGVVVDLSRFDSVEVLDPATRLVRVGAGARWAQVAAALAPHELAITSGDSGGVGVGGLATAGGIGWYARKHGLTIDRVRAVDVVLADGTALRASPSEHPELFWGMRGAGGNLAVATSFDIEAHDGGPLGFAQLVLDASHVARFLERWGEAVETASRDVTSFLLMGRPRPGEPPVAQVMVAVDSPNPETVIAHLEPFARIAPLLDQAVRIAPYRGIIVPPSGPHRGEGEPVSRSSLVAHMSGPVARAAEQVVTSGAAFFFQVRAVGGAVSDVPAEATAYAHRGARFSLIGIGASRAQLDPVWDELHAHAEGLYLSFETDPRPERLHDAFPRATLARLRAVKERYDPGNLFRDNFPVVR